MAMTYDRDKSWFDTNQPCEKGGLPLDRKRDDGSRQLSGISRIGLPRTKTLLRVVMIVDVDGNAGRLRRAFFSGDRSG